MAVRRILSSMEIILSVLVGAGIGAGILALAAWVVWLGEDLPERLAEDRRTTPKDPTP
jgi:hypothetical protein